MASTPEIAKAPINPYNKLLVVCENDPATIQAHYESHRTNRNSKFKLIITGLDFPGWEVDEILSKLVAQSKNPNGDSTFSDHRHNLNLYARPPRQISDLIAIIQEELRYVAPTLWFSPPESLHITILEIINSRTQGEINDLAAKLLENGTAQKLVNYTTDLEHRTRLIKPMLSFDGTAMALSFLPATGEPSPSLREQSNDTYGYHHLRRDLADLVLESGTPLAARYVVPSAHVTIARFVSQDGFLLENGEVDRATVVALIERIERINEMLKGRYWSASVDHEDGCMWKDEWVIGQDQGLEFNKGTSWYGGGEKVLVGFRRET